MINECDQLRSEKKHLERQVENTSAKFQKMWPTITEVVPNAPGDFFMCQLIECCEHVKAYTELTATNRELCNIFVSFHKVILDPTI